MKTKSCDTFSPAVSNRLRSETRTHHLLRAAGIHPLPRRTCSRLLNLGQAAAFLMLFTACADAALDAFDDAPAPQLTPAEISNICQAENYASDACIEWAANTPVTP